MGNMYELIIIFFAYFCDFNLNLSRQMIYNHKTNRLDVTKKKKIKLK